MTVKNIEVSYSGQRISIANSQREIERILSDPDCCGISVYSKIDENDKVIYTDTTVVYFDDDGK